MRYGFLLISVLKTTTLKKIISTIAFIRLLVTRSRLNAIDAIKALLTGCDPLPQALALSQPVPQTFQFFDLSIDNRPFDSKNRVSRETKNT